MHIENYNRHYYYSHVHMYYKVLIGAKYMLFKPACKAIL